MSIKLYETDFCILNDKDEPVRIKNGKFIGDIALFSKDAIKKGKIDLYKDERIVKTTELPEKIKTELIEQIKKYQKELIERINKNRK